MMEIALGCSLFLAVVFFVCWFITHCNLADRKDELEKAYKHRDKLYRENDQFQKDNKYLTQVNKNSVQELTKVYKIIEQVERDIKVYMGGEDLEIDWEYIAKNHKYVALIRALNRLESLN
jgi:hypothetical protein